LQRGLVAAHDWVFVQNSEEVDLCVGDFSLMFHVERRDYVEAQQIAAE
jgi:hypothetical protein